MVLNTIQKLSSNTCKIIYQDVFHDGNFFKTVKVINSEILKDVQFDRNYHATLKSDFVKDGDEIFIDRIIFSRFFIKNPIDKKTVLCTYQIKQK